MCFPSLGTIAIYFNTGCSVGGRYSYMPRYVAGIDFTVAYARGIVATIIITVWISLNSYGIPGWRYNIQHQCHLIKRQCIVISCAVTTITICITSQTICITNSFDCDTSCTVCYTASSVTSIDAIADTARNNLNFAGKLFYTSVVKINTSRSCCTVCGNRNTAF